MRWAMVASGCRKARAISSVVRPQIIRSASAARASRDRFGRQAGKMSRWAGRGARRHKTAIIVRWMSAAVIAADWIYRTPASGVRAHIDLARTVDARRREGTNLAGAFPARHMLEVQLHEFPRRRHR